MLGGYDQRFCLVLFCWFVGLFGFAVFEFFWFEVFVQVGFLFSFLCYNISVAL